MANIHTIDWVILATYLFASIGIGLWMRRYASEDIENYFVAGRKMSGWLVGTSMVATTFAADTPLAVTGIVAKNGIAGNWFWWSLAFSHLTAAFIFARQWRRAEIITDAEFIELRYSGRSATCLRLLRAFFFAIPINCIIMAWVIRAMGKIVSVVFPWDKWLPQALYASLQTNWPEWIAVKTPSEAISICIGVLFATFYATLGGLPSVIITDVIQFCLAMIGSVMLAWYAIDHIGGLSALTEKLSLTYGEEAAGITAFFPSSEAAWLPLQVFLVYILVQWWAQKFSDGGGILIQRMSAAKDENHALRGTSWFVIAHYALRPWPWIIVALVALVLFPLESTGILTNHPEAATVLADREMAYPILMAQFLPPGLLGIMITGMAAAFMSTVDTHITWGSSYLTKDIYQRFIHPEATQRELVKAGRTGVIFIVLLALAFTTQIHTIEGAWKFITVMGSGIGLVTMARWFWWRINAASEITGLVSATILSLLLYGTSLGEGLPYHHALLFVVTISTLAIIVVTYLTAAPDLIHLRLFYEKVRPMGWWGPVQRATDPAPEPLGPLLVAWVIAAISLFALLFGIGEWLIGSTPLGIGMVIGGAVGWYVALKKARAFGPGKKEPLKTVLPTT